MRLSKCHEVSESENNAFSGTELLQHHWLFINGYRSHALIYDFSKALIRINEIRESEVLVETYHYVVNDVNISRQK